jgi:transcriptional regulator with XRE-family HTH domain
MRNRQESEKDNFEMIDSWKKSGLSQKEFCKRAGIGYHIFHYWLKKYKSGSKTGTSGFVSLHISETINTVTAEIILPNGTRILLKSVDSSYIRSLIS